MSLKILAIGDVVREPGVRFCEANLWKLRRDTGADLVIVNAENSFDMNGVTPSTADRLFAAGADVLTGGNHTFARREIYDYLDEHESCIRPANYPGSAPGFGWTIADAAGWRVLVINLMGTVFMDPLDSPFKKLDEILRETEGTYDLAVVDFHAEATSEKGAFARYADGRVSAVFGTHTHVQTADECVLPKGTGFITDLGMTGCIDSVLGVKCEPVIRRFLTRMPTRFETPEGPVAMTGALFSIDQTSQKCQNVERIRIL